MQALLLAVVGWVFGVLALVGLGVDFRDSIALSTVVLIQGVTGGYLWYLIRGQRVTGVLELVGLGLILGTILFMLTGVILRPLINTAWVSLLPSLALTLVFLYRALRVRQNILVSTPSHWQDVWPAVAGVALGIGVLTLNLQRYPLNWTGTWDQYHPDMIFFEALSNSASRYGGSDSIFMAGADIRYHWFSYAWVGQMTELVGAQPFVVLTRLLPLVALVALIAVALAWARSLLNSREMASARFTSFVPWLVMALLVTGGYVGALNGTILNFDSPSQALGTAWLLGLIVVTLQYLNSSISETGMQRLLSLAVIALIAVAATGAKVSTGALAVAAIALMAVVSSLFRLEWAKRAWVALLVVSAAFAAVYFLVIAGSASPGDLQVFSWYSRASTIQGLDSSPSNVGVLLGTLGLILAIGARWVGGIWLVRDKVWRTRPETLLAIGLVIGGVIPLLVFSQGLNETWFALAASAPLSVLGAVGLWVGWNSVHLGNRTAVFTLVFAAVSLFVVSYVWTDQVWESGFGRFWSPWLAYLLALIAGIAVALAVGKQRLVTAFVIATTVLTLQASVARALPVIGSVLGGARDGAGVTAAQLAEISVRETESVEPASEVAPVTEVVMQEAPATSVEQPTIVVSSVLGWSENELLVADYLGKEASPTDVIVTNQTSGFIIPALTGLRSFITGTDYQSVYGGKGTVGEIPQRVEVSRSFISQPNATDLAVLCAAGVKWVWVNRSIDPDSQWSEWGTVVVNNESVTLIRIDNCGG